MTGFANPRPFAEWHEDRGDVLWFFSPVSEPPYCGSPLDCGRTMSIEIQIGFEQVELPTRDVGGWPWNQEDEVQLWWVPLPDANALQAQIDAIDAGQPIFDSSAAVGDAAISVLHRSLSAAQRKLLARLMPQPGTSADERRFVYSVQSRGAGLQSCAAFVARQMAISDDYHHPHEQGQRGYVRLTPLGDLIRKRISEDASRESM
ncbi:MAG: hypothetical protein I8H86_06275 [Sphingomonadaceae bacterium]|nr:hypothetical protein [Sphingomonadaceae bacterium]